MARRRPEFESGEADAEAAQLIQVVRMQADSKTVASRHFQKPILEVISV